MVAGKCVAQATSCQVHLALQMESTSSKDSVGDFEEQDPVGKSWDMQTDSLVAITDNGTNGETTIDLIDLMLNATKVTLTFDQTAGTNNRQAQNSTIKMTGQAYLVDLNITAQNRANSTQTAQFQGTGALTRASA